MSIKILAVSPEDLNIYSEIASTVFRKVDTLRDELKNTMSGMLAEAPNDPGQTETVVVTLTIPEITGIFYPTKESYHLPFSVEALCNTFK